MVETLLPLVMFPVLQPNVLPVWIRLNVINVMLTMNWKLLSLAKIFLQPNTHPALKLMGLLNQAVHNVMKLLNSELLLKPPPLMLLENAVAKMVIEMSLLQKPTPLNNGYVLLVVKVPRHAMLLKL